MAKEKNLTAVTSVAAADFLRVVTSAGASVKATLSNLKASMGVTALENRFKYVSSGSFNDLQTYGLYLTQSLTDSPYQYITSYALIVSGSTSTTKQIAYATANDDRCWIRNYVSGAWSAWTQMPTRDEVDSLNSKISETAIGSGSIDDIVKTGIYYVGNAVTGKPNGITGAGTGGMLIVMYLNPDNYVKIFVRNTDISSQFAYVRRVNGGIDMGWALIK